MIRNTSTSNSNDTISNNNAKTNIIKECHVNSVNTNANNSNNKYTCVYIYIYMDISTYLHIYIYT